MVTDYLLPFSLQSCAEHIIGCGFSIGSTGCKNALAHLRGKLFQNIRADTQRDLTSPSHPLPSHFLADVSCQFCCSHTNHHSNFHVYLYPFYPNSDLCPEDNRNICRQHLSAYILLLLSDHLQYKYKALFHFCQNICTIFN